MARRPAKNTVTVNFKGVDLAGGAVHIPEGDYRMKVESVKKAVSKSDNDMLAWQFIGLEGKAKNKRFYLYTTLTEESLWKLGQTLEALGQDIPDDEMDIDLDELIDLECIGTVIDEEYQDKPRSKLQGITTAEAAGESHPVKGRNGKEVKVAAKEVEDMSEDELEDLVDKHDLEVDLTTSKTLRRKAAAVIAALEEKDLLEA